MSATTICSARGVSDLISQLTVCGWHYSFFSQTDYICYILTGSELYCSFVCRRVLLHCLIRYQEWVVLWLSLPDRLIWLNPWLIGSEWHCSFLSKEVSSTLNPFELTVCKNTFFANCHHMSNSSWGCCNLYESRQSCHISTPDQQLVSDIVIISARWHNLMSNRLWVKAPQYFLLKPSHCCILSYGQQVVSDIVMLSGRLESQRIQSYSLRM